MMVAFDLDGTLLHTQKHLTTAPGVIPVEWRQGEAFGFMTPGALAALRGIQQRAVCLVNTLRGLEQARRVDFVGDGSCRYLALQNGLYLYRDGCLDQDWTNHVNRMVGELPLGLTEGVRRVLSALPGIDVLSKQYEYLAVFFVNETFDDAACASLAAELAHQGWVLVRQRKKLYLLPACIDKGAVLNRVRELEGGDEALGFGDSGFDLPFLRLCAAAWAPCGCELAGTDRLRFSDHPAQAGTEEVLRLILAELSPSSPFPES